MKTKLHRRDKSLCSMFRVFRLQGQLKTNQEILIVHQMGKVGSSSVVKSLETYLQKPIIHTHILNQNRLNEHLCKIKKKGLSLEENVRVSQCISQRMPDIISKKRWKIITLVREPISRNISAYFQNLDKTHIKNCLSQYQNQEISLEEIVNHFFHNYPHHLPLQWLDWEIKEVFGIDVYQSPFLPEQGYQIYKKGKIDLLLIRLESLNHCWNTAIKDFFYEDSYKSKAIELKKANIAEKKDYSDLYRECRKSIKIPEEYIEKMYQSKYARQFYTDRELEQFKDYWLMTK